MIGLVSTYPARYHGLMTTTTQPALSDTTAALTSATQVRILVRTETGHQWSMVVRKDLLAATLWGITVPMEGCNTQVITGIQPA